jgi:hypothetical protein
MTETSTSSNNACTYTRHFRSEISPLKHANKVPSSMPIGIGVLIVVTAAVRFSNALSDIFQAPGFDVFIGIVIRIPVLDDPPSYIVPSNKRTTWRKPCNMVPFGESLNRRPHYIVNSGQRNDRLIPAASMLDLARHIDNQKAGRFEPEKFEDHYETALIDLINSKRLGKPITPKEQPRGENVVDLMDVLRKSASGAAAETKAPKKAAKKPRKAAAGQKEMLMPIEGKKAKEEATAKKPAARPQRKSA